MRFQARRLLVDLQVPPVIFDACAAPVGRCGAFLVTFNLLRLDLGCLVVMGSHASLALDLAPVRLYVTVDGNGLPRRRLSELLLRDRLPSLWSRLVELLDFISDPRTSHISVLIVVFQLLLLRL